MSTPDKSAGKPWPFLFLLDRNRWLDVLLLVALALATWKATGTIHSWLDLHLDDEAYYLGHGLGMAKPSIPHASWGPLYTMWYGLLADWGTDKAIALYYLNQRVLCVLVPVALFAALRSFGVNRMVAVIFSWLVAVSDLNIVTQPKVGHLAAVLLLATFAISAFCRSTRATLAVLLLGVLSASYVRPEYFPGAVLLMLAWGSVEIKSLRSSRARTDRWYFALPAVTLASIVAAFVSLGIPLGSRSFAAFSQHFGLNWLRWHPEQNLNAWTDMDIIIQETFPGASSVSEALMANPPAFVKHIAQNLLNLSQELWVAISHHTAITTSFRSSPEMESLGLVLLIAGTGLGGMAANLKNSAAFLKSQGARVAGIVATLAGGLAAVLLVHPDRHYLISLGVCFVAGLLAWVATQTTEKGASSMSSPLQFKLGLVTALLLPAITPVSSPEYASPLPNLEMVKALRKLKPTEPAVLLCSTNHGRFMIGKKWKNIPHQNKERNQDFRSFVSENGVNVIAVDPRIESDSRYRDDADWVAFLKDPGSMGFRELPPVAVNTPRQCRLFVSTSLVKD